MEQLLRDGGDLDSMDRSLLDYNPAQQHPNRKHPMSADAHAGQQLSPGVLSPTSATAGGSSAAAVNGDMSLDTPATPNTAVILSPATPPVSPVTSPEGVTLPPIIKRDLVVRFNEKGQQNSVQHHAVTADPSAADNGSKPAVKYKEQYEAHRRAAAAAAPPGQRVTSPCDSCDSASYLTHLDAQRNGKLLSLTIMYCKQQKH